MYRNTYLEMYKTASAADTSVTFMFAHFTQIYNTLGCVLQDLEYQMGKLLVQQQVSANEKLKESYEHYQRPKQKSKDKQIIKIEESQAEVAPLVVRQNNEFEMQINQSKPRNTQDNKEKAYPKQWQPEASIMEKNRETKQHNPREKTQERVLNYPAQITRKKMDNPKSTDSFESFFEPKKPDRAQRSQKQLQNHALLRNPNIPQQITNPVIENTYDDFLDRFFKEDKSKKRN